MIIGNQHGMNPVKAMQAAKKADQNHDGQIELRELKFSPKVLQMLDGNHDRRLEVKELAHGLARGDVFVNTDQKAIHAYPDRPIKLFSLKQKETGHANN